MPVQSGFQVLLDPLDVEAVWGGQDDPVPFRRDEREAVEPRVVKELLFFTTYARTHLVPCGTKHSNFLRR